MNNSFVLLLSDTASIRIRADDPSPVSFFLKEIHKRSKSFGQILQTIHEGGEKEVTPLQLADVMQGLAKDFIKEVEARDGDVDNHEHYVHLLNTSRELLKDASVICAFEMGGMLSNQSTDIRKG